MAAPKRLLENSRRRAIYDAVREAPGIHMRELQRRTGLRWGALQYHTGKLIGQGLLHAARSGKSRVLACDVHRLSPEQIKGLHLLRRGRARAVAGALAASRGATRREVAERSGVHPRIVGDYLRTMLELGFARAAGPAPRTYHPTARLGEALARLDGAGPRERGERR